MKFDVLQASVNRMRSLIQLARFVALITVCLMTALVFPVVGQTRYPREQWEKTRRPEDLGWSSDKLRLAREYSQTIDTDAVVIVLNGMILDEWGETARRYRLHSARKSFLSALYGIHVHESRIKLDKTLRKLGIDDSPPSLTPAEKEATIRDLLNARSGVFHAGAYQGAVPTRPPRGRHPPGTYWFYSNWDFNVLGTIFEQETGTRIFHELQRRIAEPLQMEDFRAEDGYYFFGNESIHPAYPIRMTARDAARFGLLFLRKGKWRDRQIIPAVWVEQSTRSYSDTGDGKGYGYMWWVFLKGKRLDGGAPLPSSGYYASGAGGHKIIVFPFADLVVVHRVNTDIPDRRVTDSQIERLLRLILESRSSIPDRRVVKIAAGPAAEPPADSPRNRLDHGLINTAEEATVVIRPDLSFLYTKAVQAALKAGANANSKDNNSRTALMFAAAAANSSMVEALLKAGAEVNAKDGIFGQTPLMYAAAAGSVIAVQMLLDAKCDIDAKTRLGQTALMEAAAKGHTPVVQVLLRARADVNAKRMFGETALMLAAGNGQVATAESLLNAGADPNVNEQDGQTALIRAAKNGHAPVVEALLKAGADVNLADKGGQTALMLAAGSGQMESLRILLDGGANMNHQGRVGETALMLAAMRGRMSAVQALLAAGADPNAKSKYGQTALMLASMYGQREVVKALIAANADLNIKDKDGMTASDRAAAEQQTAIVRLLQDAAANKE